MTNLHKKLPTSLATFAIALTMGTVTTTTTTQASCCDTTHHCPTYQHYITTSKNMMNHYANYPHIKQHWETKLAHWQKKYDTYCVFTGTLCGYVFVDSSADLSYGVTVTITQADGSTKTTTVGANGKWTISDIKEGTVTVSVNKTQIENKLSSDYKVTQVFDTNSNNTATVVANKLNEGGVDLFIVVPKS